MTPRTRSLALLLVLLLLSWAVVGSFIGCSNEKKQIAPPVVGPSAGSGPMGGGETQSLQLTASPSEDLTTIGEEQGTISITALVENSIGQPMPDGTPVYWSTTKGTITPTTGTVSNGSSDASITFSQRFDGCSDVTARSGDASDRIKLCVNNVEATPTTAPTVTPIATATPSKIFIVSASPITISHNGKSDIRAFASTNGTPDRNLQVNFNASGAGILNASANATDASGNATVTLNGNNSAGTTAQTVIVTATAADGRTGTVTVIVNAP